MLKGSRLRRGHLSKTEKGEHLGKGKRGAPGANGFLFS